MFLIAVPALQQLAFEVSGLDTLVIRAYVSKAYLLATGAHATIGDRIELEFARGNNLLFAYLFILMPFTVFLFLLAKLGVSASEFIVRDEGVDVIIMQVLHVCFIRKARVGGNNSLGS